MRFRLEHHFDAPIDVVAATLVDPDYIEQMAELPGVGRPEVLDQHTVDRTWHQSVRYRFVGDLPAVARAFVDPARLSWVEVSATDLDAHTTTWRLDADHYADRFTCQGTSSLTSTGAGTTRVLDGDLRLKVAFVGGKAEKGLVSGLTERLAGEPGLLAAFIRSRQLPG